MYSSPLNFLGEEEGEISSEKDVEVDPIENPMTLQTLELCLKKLPDYYVYGFGLEWTNYFERCRILVSPNEPEAVYASNPINILVIVNKTKLTEVVERARQLLEEKIEELKKKIGESK